ncbi:MAG: hypothetical protein D6689_10370 [Deltaproteobacteria bacterium]|nr:MAG: hypothetical protein D6689_10370 [Deltaproteobacteria bacterium]
MRSPVRRWYKDRFAVKRATEGSTAQLVQLCAGYFACYVVTAISVKYFLSTGMEDMQYLVYSTVGGSAAVFPVVVGLRWYRMQSNRPVTWLGVRWPSELAYIIPSGVCTAVVIPTTTLMYTLPITVMVAMTMMRGSVIVASRAVDAIQIRQGILHKRVYPEENLAVVLALGAVGVHIAYGVLEPGAFDFLTNPAALVIFCSYIGAYAVRIYLMNYYKNTRAKGVKLDNKGFFALEQFAATGAMIFATVLLVSYVDDPRVDAVRRAFTDPAPRWQWATASGLVFGASAFFSVFLFLFKGRTATFAGLVNRLTSLVAGTTATLIWWAFGGRAVHLRDWLALGFVLGAVHLLARAERRRAAEVAAEAAAG